MRNFDQLLYDLENVYLRNKTEIAHAMGVSTSTAYQWRVKDRIGTHQAKYTERAIDYTERRIAEFQDLKARLERDLEELNEGKNEG